MNDFIFTPENVNSVIQLHIGEWEARIAELHPVNSKETIDMMRFAIHALIAIQHDLHLCHCPPEMYKDNEVES